MFFVEAAILGAVPNKVCCIRRAIDHLDFFLGAKIGSFCGKAKQSQGAYSY
jgi:hypothetical protein